MWKKACLKTPKTVYKVDEFVLYMSKQCINSKNKEKKIEILRFILNHYSNDVLPEIRVITQQKVRKKNRPVLMLM